MQASNYERRGWNVRVSSRPLFVVTSKQFDRLVRESKSMIYHVIVKASTDESTSEPNRQQASMNQSRSKPEERLRPYNKYKSSISELRTGNKVKIQLKKGTRRA